MRKILLVEPDYSNKYPPVGLMKIATYHRMLGDSVRFFKGDLRDLVIDLLTDECLARLGRIDISVDWISKRVIVRQFVKTKKNQLWLIEELDLLENKYHSLILQTLLEFADIYKRKLYQQWPKYDRVYVTTLFTFYWKITVDTIHFCKTLVKKPEELLVGGILASLLHDELEKATGVKPVQGLLDKRGILDPKLTKAKSIVVDDLPLDYSILDEVDYQYPTRSAYFTFMTKGCTRSCAFCSVPILEPQYKPKIDTSGKFADVTNRFGEQQNLLLMDNNVLASPKFIEIVDEIKSMGFTRGATYVEPNQLAIAIENLQSGYNDFGFIRRSFRLLHSLLPRLKGTIAQDYYNALAEFDLLLLERATKDNLIAVFPKVSETYAKYRNKAPRKRYVDFNQGTDCRYVTDKLMKKMSEIPIRPLRIAFDYIGLEKQYREAVRLAVKYGITQLSNYILYNFNDKPEDLYNRLRINAELCKEFDAEIFSFPMKYIPLFGEEAKDRKYTGKHWNKKFIRAIQSVLNVTKGIVAPSQVAEKTSFFEEAFGKNLEAFRRILYMPEPYIIYRHLFSHKLGYTQVWEEEYATVLESETDRTVAHKIIEENDFSDATINLYNASSRVRHFLRHYAAINRRHIHKDDEEYRGLKSKFDQLIKEDQFIELTLTYDYDISGYPQTRI